MKAAIFAAALLVLFIGNARACVTGPWHSGHKTMHLVDTGIIAASAAAVTKNAYMGVAAGVIAGAVREKYKQNVGASCEWASITYDLVGIAIGVGAVQHWYIAPMDKGVQVGYFKQF